MSEDRSDANATETSLHEEDYETYQIFWCKACNAKTYTADELLKHFQRRHKLPISPQQIQELPEVFHPVLKDLSAVEQEIFRLESLENSLARRLNTLHAHREFILSGIRSLTPTNEKKVSDFCGHGLPFFECAACLEKRKAGVAQAIIDREKSSRFNKTFVKKAPAIRLMDLDADLIAKIKGI